MPFYRIGRAGPPVTKSLVQLSVAGGWLVVQLARGRGAPAG